MMDLTQKQWVKHSVFHPFEGFEDLRWKKGGSVLYATIVVLLWFVAQIIHDNLVGYQFAVTNTKMFSIVPYIVQTIAVFLVFVIGNWSICTLLDGEGTIKKIYIYSAYSLIPYVAGLYIRTILSHVLIQDEVIFITCVTVISTAWSVLLMFNAIKAVHQYSIGKTILALLLSLVTTLPVDGIIGTAVSLFILKTAFDIIRDTVGDLLGRPADAETVQQLKTLVLSHDKIEGIHDLILHNYGPGRTIGSCHVEVRSDSNFVEVHEVVDTIEREIEEKLKIMMTIHMDPIELDNETVNHYREMTQQVVEGLHQKLSLHDFRLVSGENSNRLIFDLLVPFECDYTDEELLEMISGELHRMDQTCSVSITFDRDFTEE